MSLFIGPWSRDCGNLKDLPANKRKFHHQGTDKELSIRGTAEIQAVSTTYRAVTIMTFCLAINRHINDCI